MKRLMYLIVLAILVIAGCAKDDTIFEEPGNLELKKANVPIPMKGRFERISRFEIRSDTHIGT